MKEHNRICIICGKKFKTIGIRLYCEKDKCVEEYINRIREEGIEWIKEKK